VTSEAVMIRDFDVNGAPLLELDLKAARPEENADDPRLSEWVIGVEWKKAVPRDQAVAFKGIFANQNIVCKLRHPETVEFLEQRFGATSRT
jgi:hypothetical protein